MYILFNLVSNKGTLADTLDAELNKSEASTYTKLKSLDIKHNNNDKKRANRFIKDSKMLDNSSSKNLLSRTKEILSKSTSKSKQSSYDSQKNSQRNFLSNKRNENHSNKQSKTSYTNKTSANSSLVITNITDKDKKHKQLKEKFEETRSNLIKEKQRNIELTKQIKNIIKKEENYSKLEEMHANLLKKFENLHLHFQESEVIRKEQSKLIKIMQNEIEFLREKKDNNNFTEENIDYIPLNKKKKSNKTTLYKSKELKANKQNIKY